MALSAHASAQTGPEKTVVLYSTPAGSPNQSTLASFAAVPEEGGLYSAFTAPEITTPLASYPVDQLSASFSTDVPSEAAYAHFFLHDPSYLADYRMSHGGGQNSVCYYDLPWGPAGVAGNTIGEGYTPYSSSMWSGSPQPVERDFSLAAPGYLDGFNNPPSPASDAGGRIKAVLINDDGPCHQDISFYDDIAETLHPKLLDTLVDQMASSGKVYWLERHYSTLAPWLSNIHGFRGWAGSPATFSSGFHLDFSMTADLQDPSGIDTYCAHAVYEFGLHRPSFTSDQPELMRELFGGVLGIDGGIISSYAGGLVGGPMLEEEINQGINAGLANEFAGAIVTDAPLATPLTTGENDPLLCTLDAEYSGAEDNCTNAVSTLQLAVRAGVGFLRDNITTFPTIEAQIPASWNEDDWDAFERALVDAVGVELAPSTLQYPPQEVLEAEGGFTWGDAEKASRTSWRNFRCIKNPGLDAEFGLEVNRGVCAPIPRAKRLSRRHGGVTLVWFDNPWTDHVDERGQRTDAAFTIALWVALHATVNLEEPPPDGFGTIDDDLCAPTAAFDKYPLNFATVHSYGYAGYQF